MRLSQHKSQSPISMKNLKCQIKLKAQMPKGILILGFDIYLVFGF
jgi:hypothetical protein